MHKKNFAVICIFLCLFVAVWISLKLNQPNIEEQKKLLDSLLTNAFEGLDSSEIGAEILEKIQNVLSE